MQRTANPLILLGQALSFGYDALGRLLTQGSALGTMSSQYDLAGRRTRLGWADGFYVTYDYLVTGEPLSVRENGAVSGPGVLAVFGYDDRGNRTSLTRGNGTSASYAADAVSRLASLGDDLPGSAYDRTTSFAYNPASQLASVTRSNDGYAYNGHYNHSDATTINGLNQATATGGTSIAYDARGNVTAIGVDGYGYSAENLLTSGPWGTTLAYDPIGRLSQLSQAGTTRFGYDGADLTAEYDLGGTLQRRYVYAPGGEPLVWYEGGGTGDRRWLHADERGSIVAVSDGAGRALGTNGYDDYGQPAPTNMGRIGYTGQAWLPELNLWYYKARMYAPGLGRFLQTDPIGYGDGLNWYGYVGGDPVNFVDPSGLSYIATFLDGTTCTFDYKGDELVDLQCAGGGGGGNYGADIQSSVRRNGLPDDIVVTAKIGNVANPVPNTSNANQGQTSSPRGIIFTSTNGIPTPPNGLSGGPYTPKPNTPGNKPGSFQGPKQPSGPRSQAQYVPPEAEGGPPGSQGYFKTQVPGQQNFDRFDLNGNPLTPDQAHPNPIGPTRNFFFLGPFGAGLCVLFCESPAY